MAVILEITASEMTDRKADVNRRPTSSSENIPLAPAPEGWSWTRAAARAGTMVKPERMPWEAPGLGPRLGDRSAFDRLALARCAEEISSRCSIPCTMRPEGGREEG